MTPSLGLAMIVRDEAQDLPRCLASVQDVVEQVVIVDTGSRDQTIEIAQAWGAQVIQSAWENDFAQARNVSLKAIQTDWVLVLDADEALVPEVKQTIQASIEQHDLIAIALLRHEVGVIPPYSAVSRLFRRHPDIYFSRPYHETIDDAVLALMQQEPHWQIGQLEGVAIQHWGYTPSRLQHRDKVTQAIVIMSEYLAAHPEDAYICAKLGGMYLQAGQWDLAQITLEQGLNISAIEPSVASELHYQLGNYYSQVGRQEPAIEQYQAAIREEIPPITKISAQIRLAQAWSRQKNYGQAIAAYETVITLAPEFPLAWQNLGVIYLKLGQIQTSRKYFLEAIHRLKITDPAEAQRLQSELAAMGFILT
ncbi:glycosyltransferase family 2 protein [Synechococcus sp. PCC 6312]|uniref:glycosyltransferase n=1 Tax=Synechococcus sp. (strain ATCC 27167 / PCC 6312) TaxID=195253 RepID=UPI00029EC49F|nr:glycosyltransferase family 2 protein [Synechococcus sp. PCC 6312]AFY61132.1 glycosyl transferase [Synechococcus sp. PCC 6312]